MASRVATEALKVSGGINITSLVYSITGLVYIRMNQCETTPMAKRPDFWQGQMTYSIDNQML